MLHTQEHFGNVCSGTGTLPCINTPGLHVWNPSREYNLPGGLALPSMDGFLYLLPFLKKLGWPCLLKPNMEDPRLFPDGARKLIFSFKDVPYLYAPDSEELKQGWSEIYEEHREKGSADVYLSVRRFPNNPTVNAMKDILFNGGCEGAEEHPVRVFENGRRAAAKNSEMLEAAVKRVFGLEPKYEVVL